MRRRAPSNVATTGVSDHGGWAVLVTVAGDGRLIDRRRVVLVDAALPALPHHHDAQRLPVADGVALVARVARSAGACAKRELAALAAAVPVTITAIALRACPPLPATVAERIADVWAQNRADWVMYRNALARAAAARGWIVHWYDARGVPAAAARVLGVESIDGLLAKTGAALGPPWQKDHKLAMAAAIAARDQPIAQR